jgi:hypothetical protein
MDLSERIGRRLKLQDLHVLMVVAQVGSMGRAAERRAPARSQPEGRRAHSAW